MRRPLQLPHRVLPFNLPPERQVSAALQVLRAKVAVAASQQLRGGSWVLVAGALAAADVRPA